MLDCYSLRALVKQAGTDNWEKGLGKKTKTLRQKARYKVRWMTLRARRGIDECKLQENKRRLRNTQTESFFLVTLLQTWWNTVRARRPPSVSCSSSPPSLHPSLSPPLYTSPPAFHIAPVHRQRLNATQPSPTFPQMAAKPRRTCCIYQHNALDLTENGHCS